MLVGPGDDAAVLRIKHGHVVVSTDLMVEGRHFRRDWASAEDVGHRAAAQNLSDINAMGGTARHLTIGLAAPADLPGRSGRSTSPAASPRSARASARRVVGRRRHPRRPGRDRRHRPRPVHPGARPALGRPARRRPRAHRSPGLGRRRPRGPRSRLPLPAGAGRGLPPARAAVRRGQGGRRGRGHLPDRRLRRPPRRGRAPRGRERRRHRRTHAARSRSPSRSRPSGAALGADPLQFILGGGDDHSLLATFPDAASVPAGLAGRRRGAARARASPSTAGAYDGPTGWTHF